jgi:hypothetical protein
MTQASMMELPFEDRLEFGVCGLLDSVVVEMVTGRNGKVGATSITP